MPSHATLVPACDATLHFVLCDFGKLGQAYLETDPNEADRDAIVNGLVSGQYPRPLKIIALQPDGTWRDASLEIARSAMKAAAAGGSSLPEGTRDFVAIQIGQPVSA
jgi:hypothetical protein